MQQKETHGRWSSYSCKMLEFDTQTHCHRQCLLVAEILQQQRHLGCMKPKYTNLEPK